MSERDQHSALNARDDMLAISDIWPDLLDRLGRETSGAQDGMPRPATRDPGLVINEHVSDVMAEIRGWAHFLARVLIEETDWTPNGSDTPTMLANIARTRIGHFTQHADEALQFAFYSDAESMRNLAEQTAYPSGRRIIPLHIECLDHGTSDLGERVACRGAYTVLLDPDSHGLIPDMVCDKDKTHRITPAEWMRAQRHSRMDPDAARNLLMRIRMTA